MSDVHPLETRSPLKLALVVAALATLLTAFAGLLLFLAGAFVIGVDLGSGHPVQLTLPLDLLARGPLGWAAWMSLLMACGSPVVGLAVFFMLYFGGPHAD